MKRNHTLLIMLSLVLSIHMIYTLSMCESHTEIANPKAQVTSEGVSIIPKNESSIILYNGTTGHTVEFYIENTNDAQIDYTLFLGENEDETLINEYEIDAPLVLSFSLDDVSSNHGIYNDNEITEFMLEVRDHSFFSVKQVQYVFNVTITNDASAFANFFLASDFIEFGNPNNEIGFNIKNYDEKTGSYPYNVSLMGEYGEFYPIDKPVENWTHNQDIIFSPQLSEEGSYRLSVNFSDGDTVSNKSYWFEVNNIAPRVHTIIGFPDTYPNNKTIVVEPNTNYSLKVQLEDYSITHSHGNLTYDLRKDGSYQKDDEPIESGSYLEFNWTSDQTMGGRREDYILTVDDGENVIQFLFSITWEYTEETHDRTWVWILLGVLGGVIALGGGAYYWVKLKPQKDARKIETKHEEDIFKVDVTKDMIAHADQELSKFTL